MNVCTKNPDREAKNKEIIEKIQLLQPRERQSILYLIQNFERVHTLYEENIKTLGESSAADALALSVKQHQQLEQAITGDKA